MVCLILAACVAASDCWENLIPGMPIGNGKTLGGVHRRKGGPHTVMTAKQLSDMIDAENKRVLLSKARTAIGIGVGIIVAGFVLSAPIAAYLPRKAGDIIFYAGGGITVWGFIMASMAKSFWFLAFLALFALGIYVLQKLKPKGLFKNKEQTNAVT